MKVIVVGICGGKYGDSGVGKSTSAEALRDRLGFFYLSLMKPVKDMCAAAGHELTPENLDETCRRGRELDEDFWLNLVLREIPEGTEKVVLDDLWFSNEADFITKHGGFIIDITREGFESDPHRDFHPDTLIENHLTKEDLRDKVTSTISRYFGITPEKKV